MTRAILLLCVLTWALPPLVRADSSEPIIQVDADAHTVAGIQYSYGECPCVRWRFAVRGASGTLETRDFLISVDGLLRLQIEADPDVKTIGKGLATVGAVDALWKGGHVGLSFEGLTFGQDPDHDETNIFRTGIAAFVQILKTPAARLALKSGIHLDRMSVQGGPTEDHGEWANAAVLQWRTPHWSGEFTAFAGLNPSLPFGAGNLHLKATSSFELTPLRARGFAAGIGLFLSAEIDPLRAVFGLPADEGLAALYLDMSWGAPQ